MAAPEAEIKKKTTRIKDGGKGDDVGGSSSSKAKKKSTNSTNSGSRAPKAADVNAGTKVRVVCRIRPLSDREQEKGAKEAIVSMNSRRSSRSLLVEHTGEPEMIQVREGGEGKKRWFELDAVFDKRSSQEEVYIRSGAKNSVTESIFAGFNCTILAYGQTGAGKSFSMGTTAQGAEVGEMDGMIPRACFDLFATIQDKCDGNAQVELSYLEIYNEELRDLLVDDENKKPLKIRETMNGEVYVSGLKGVKVKSPQAIGELMDEASKRRIVAATAMNAVSSRSHAMCILRIKGIVEGEEGSDKFASKLTLVDLAGSERIKKTGATGGRVKEGININKSLLILGQVVSALADKGKNARKPPYRDSKLTRLLQDSLGGNSQTIMVACVSPADYNSEESINTLRYATSARNIKNTATRNLVKNISPEEAAKLQRENELLKKEVKELQETVKTLTLAAEAAASSSNSTASNTSSLHDDDDVDGDDENEQEAADHVEDASIGLPDSGEQGGVDKANSAAATGSVTVEDQAKRIMELEKELAKTRRRSKTNILQQSMADMAYELPSLKVEVETLKEDAKLKDELERENRRLRDELELAKIDAECAQRAAAKMSDMLEEYEDLDKSKGDKNEINFERLKKEEASLSFVIHLLENNTVQMRKLKEDFNLVMQLVNNMIRSCMGASTQRSGWFGRGGSASGVDEKCEQDAKIRTDMLNEQVDFYVRGITKLEKSIEEECSSLKEVMQNVKRESGVTMNLLKRNDTRKKANNRQLGAFRKQFVSSMDILSESLQGSDSGLSFSLKSLSPVGGSIRGRYSKRNFSQRNLFGIPLEITSESTEDTEQTSTNTANNCDSEKS